MYLSTATVATIPGQPQAKKLPQVAQPCFPKDAKFMAESLQSFQSLDEIRCYVANTLSQIENLQADRFHLSQEILYRGQEPCGIYFCLHGPRNVCLSAIWETEKNNILFYASCGRRIHRTRLVQSPNLIDIEWCRGAA